MRKKTTLRRPSRKGKANISCWRGRSAIGVRENKKAISGGKKKKGSVVGSIKKILLKRE